jgi:hypothetical protein
MKLSWNILILENMLIDPLTNSISGVQMTKFTNLIFKE